MKDTVIPRLGVQRTGSFLKCFKEVLRNTHGHLFNVSKLSQSRSLSLPSPYILIDESRVMDYSPDYMRDIYRNMYTSRGTVDGGNVKATRTHATHVLFD